MRLQVNNLQYLHRLRISTYKLSLLQYTAMIQITQSNTVTLRLKADYF